jgi:hypothetical protein
MRKTIGLFSRRSSDQPWRRFNAANADFRDLHRYQTAWPELSFQIMEYSGDSCREFSTHDFDSLKPVDRLSLVA